MIGGEPYTLGLFDTAGNTNVFASLSLYILMVSIKQKGKHLSCGRCSQVRRIMTGCVHSAIHRQTYSLYVSPLSHPHHLKTSKRRSEFRSFLHWLSIVKQIIFLPVWLITLCIKFKKNSEKKTLLYVFVPYNVSHRKAEDCIKCFEARAVKYQSYGSNVKKSIFRIPDIDK